MSDHFDLPECALAVYAHPDDLEIAFGGTAAKWINEGCEVHAVICANGGKGTQDPFANELEVAETRKIEALESSEILGIKSLTFLGFEDGNLDSGNLDGDTLGSLSNLTRRLVGVIRSVKPQCLICPDPTAVFFGSDYYNHKDHRTVGFAALDAAAPQAALPLYHKDQGSPHRVGKAYLSGTLEPDFWVDIGDFVDTKVKALRCHRSQVNESDEWLDGFVRSQSSRKDFSSYFEGFRQVRLH